MHGDLNRSTSAKLNVSHLQLQSAQWRPNWAQLHYDLGVSCSQRHDCLAAVEHFQQAIALQPNYASAYYNLGVLFDQQGQLAAAIDSYRSAITRQPDYAKAYNNLGCALFKHGQLDEALQIYRQALTLIPNWATLYNNLAQVLLAQEKLDEAVAAYGRAIELRPNWALVHYNLGKVWQQKQHWATAADCFQTAIALDPNNVLAYSDCGLVWLEQGQFPQAMACFQKAIALQPAFVEGFCRHVNDLDPQDTLNRAKITCAQFLQALQHNTCLDAVTYLGQTYHDLGDVLFEYGGFEQAEIYYQKALQIQPNEIDNYLKFGQCLSKQQRQDEAITVYQKALTIQPNSPQLYLQLGATLEQNQQPQQAIDCYRKVLQFQQQGKPVTVNSSLASGQLIPIKKIYRQTKDWVVSTTLNQSQYIEVPWGQEEKPAETIPAAPLEIPPKPKPPHPECGGVTCVSCLQRLCSQFEPLEVSKGVYQCSQKGAITVKSPPAFVAIIPQGRAWITPQKNSWLICNCLAIITAENELLADVSRDYPWYLPGCQYHDPTRHQVFRLENIAPPKPINGTVAVLSGLSGHVYYHWMVDILPRIGILRRSGINWAEIDWFVVNSTTLPFQQETLQALRIPADKIISSDRYPHIQAKRLIVPSFPGHLDWVSQGTIEFLRQHFLRETTINTVACRERIYISRANASYRRVLNEADVIKRLSQVGFVSVQLETLSVGEQISLFATAKVIVSAHGSGLTNLVFCNPNTTIIELFSPHYVRTDYWIISQHLGLNHYYLIGERFECYPLRQLMYQNPLTEDIVVNLSSLEQMLKVTDLVS